MTAEKVSGFEVIDLGPSEFVCPCCKQGWSYASVTEWNGQRLCKECIKGAHVANGVTVLDVSGDFALYASNGRLPKVGKTMSIGARAGGIELIHVGRDKWQVHDSRDKDAEEERRRQVERRLAERSQRRASLAIDILNEPCEKVDSETIESSAEEIIASLVMHVDNCAAECYGKGDYSRMNQLYAKSAKIEELRKWLAD